MKTSRINNYDAVSRYYDGLGLLVFGGTLMRSQSYFLPLIPAGSRILLVGGGTGKILERLTEIHSQGLHITYVEISEKMLFRARRRNLGNNDVDFVHAAIQDYRNEGLFDVVITPFLFDNFLPENAVYIQQKIGGMLRSEGFWLYTDFVPHAKGWKRWLLQSMYRFFGTMAQVETRELPDRALLFANTYPMQAHKTFYAGFMEAVVYRKM